MPPTNFARARSTQTKDATSILNQPVDLIEQHRDFLYFVDNNKLLRRQGLDFFSEESWTTRQFEKGIRFEQVNIPGLGIGLFQEETFSRLARPLQKKTLIGKRGQPKKSLNHEL